VGEKRCVDKVLLESPEGKRLEISRSIWEDNIKMHLNLLGRYGLDSSDSE
jgi:hypothetical protein